MATFYLPSSTTGYSTDGQYVKFRIKITENYSSANGKRLYCQLIAYRTNTGYETDGTGSVTWYLNGSSVGSTSWQYGDKPITDSSGTTMSSKYITLSNNATTAKITAKFTMSNTSVGTNTNGGTVNLTKYTITYNANGGTGAPSSQTGCYNNSITLSSTKPTRAGYTFLGWSKSSSATSSSYNSGGSYKITGDATLYAIWEAATYKITYNANGGSGAPPEKTYTYSSSGTFKLSTTQPTRTGYDFVEWNTKLDGSGTSYASGGTFNRYNVSTTLYAIWKASTYKITYNANGGSGAPSSQSYTYATSGTITLSSTTPTRTGYTFVKWNTKSDGSGTSYNPGNTFNRYNVSTTLYAIWEAKSYTITYNANGGSGAPSSQSYTYSEGDTVTLSTTVPTYSGYSFIEWNMSSDGSGTGYGSGDKFGKESSNTTLYAIWSKSAITMTLNANGGTVSKTSFTLSIGGSSNSVLTNYIPTRSGYNFLGWYTASSGGTQIYNATGQCNNDGTYWSNNKCVYTSNYTLYAQWEKKQYTISYDMNGGTGSISSQTKTHDTTLTLSSTVPTKTEHTFLGWSTSKTATSISYSAGGSFTTNADTVLYAVWKSSDTYTNIYLYSTGETEAVEFIETDNYDIPFKKGGIVNANEFIESGSTIYISEYSYTAVEIIEK